MEQKNDYFGEYRVIWPDGSLHWLRAARRFEHDAEGNPAACTSIMYDITDIKRAEERANAANQAKDHFLAVLSHELRTPLSPVLMTAAILENDPQFPSQYREDVAPSAGMPSWRHA
jgi:signal transduction histidine kinase